MQYEDKKALSDARLSNATECLEAAKSLLCDDKYKSVANRSYYTVFHAFKGRGCGTD